MAINSINLAMGASYGAYNQKLTPQTEAKLHELNIAFDPNITEAQGKALLQGVQAQQKKQELSDNKNNNSQNFNSNDLYERLLKLAKQVGIEGENLDFKQLLSLVEQAIKNKVQENSNNKAVLEELKSLTNELSSIQAQSMGSMGFNSGTSADRALEKSLEMLSLYNQNYYLNR